MSAVGIIGYGSFGQFVHELLGHYAPRVEVHVFDRKDESLGTLEAAAACGLVVLAVPIAEYKDALDAVVPHLTSASTVLDIATVKVHTTSLMRSHSGLRYISTHPMFGPYSYEKKEKSVDGLRLVLTEHTLPDADIGELRAVVESLGLLVLDMTPDEHDKMLAETLFLTHYIGQVVTKGDFKRTDIDTLSFGYLMDAVESVKHDSDLFKDVYRYNPYCREVLERFEEAEAETAATFGLL